MFVNLKDFYPQIYTADLFCELPEEIVAAIKQSIRENHAYNERRRVHRAYYSLSNIPEKEWIFFVASPEDLFEQEWMAPDAVYCYPAAPVQTSIPVVCPLLPRPYQIRDCPDGRGSPRHRQTVH